MQSLSIQLPPDVAHLVSDAALVNYGQMASGANFDSASKDTVAQLNDLTIGELFPSTPKNRTMADCCLSGLWLLHGMLNSSHDISQTIGAAEGSFWHGIMHRLEPDFWNSKYWYRKTAGHPVVNELAKLHSGYPEKFVDASEAAEESGGDSQVAEIAIQEWILLFEYCYKNAE